jgi:FtsP/CotA-like multicopper oxidase with cupredoxin domain
MSIARFLAIVAITLTSTGSAQASPQRESTEVVTHENDRPAGRMVNGVLSLSLRAGVGRWFPEGQGSAPREIQALGEEGQPLSIPSPFIRVRAGTEVNIAIRNTLNAPLRVIGLCNRPGPCESLTIAPSATGNTRFTASAAGTFHYWATTTNQPVALRDGVDSQLGGVIIVDDGVSDPRERVFLIGMLRKGPGVIGDEMAVFNGRTWPHNDRLRHAIGDTVRWRVVNLSAVAHAMHLHGFYFNVESTGDGLVDARRAPGTVPPVVTERVVPGGTFAMSWIPERPGNWLFHCHMLVHMHAESPATPSAAHHATQQSAAGMAGLVIGVEVSGPDEAAPVPDSARRRLRLTINPDTRFGAAPSYRVELSEDGVEAPRVNQRAAPGPILVVTRGQPLAVEIMNRLAEPTAIHWHGIELESFNDGVPDFGGSSGSITPPVAPQGSFTARFTPPRAGTFIYHTHWHNPGQLAGGIYGPLIVLEPGQRYDPESDHIIVVGLEGQYRSLPDEPFAINGETEPRPLELKAGVPHRLRFINITGDGVNLTLQLLSLHDPIRWTPLAKDGWATPPQARALRPSRQLIAVGETYDFELPSMAPRLDGLWMELRRGNGEMLIQWPVRVR